VARHSPNKYLREIAEREMARIRDAIAAGRTDLGTKKLATPVVLMRRP
jgi:hypothetical protein